MTEDFYCDEVLSGRTPVKIVRETDNVLAYHHTRPFWPVHIVVIPKRHISSLVTLEEADEPLLLEMLSVVREVAKEVLAEHGACRVLTNLGKYQDSKHLHWHVAQAKAAASTCGSYRSVTAITISLQSLVILAILQKMKVVASILLSACSLAICPRPTGAARHSSRRRL